MGTQNNVGQDRVLVLCASRRDEVRYLTHLIQENITASQLDNLCVAVTKNSYYLPMLGSFFSHAAIPCSIAYRASLADRPLWRQWYGWHEFLVHASHGYGVSEGLSRLLHCNDFMLDSTEIGHVVTRLKNLPVNISLQQLMSVLSNHGDLASFATLLQQMPGMDVWNPQDPKERLRLLEWLTRAAQQNQKTAEPFDSEEATLLRKILSTESEDLTELFVKVRQQEIAVQFEQDRGVEVVAITQASDRLLSTKKRLIVLGMCQQDLLVVSEKQRSKLLAHLLARKAINLFTPLRDFDGSELTPILLPSSWHSRDGNSLFPRPGVGKRDVQAPISPEPPLPKQLSTSAVAQYALCPYRYLARYLFKLDAKPAPSYWGLQPQTLGEVAHKVLEIKLPEALAGSEINASSLDKVAAKTFVHGFHSLLQQLEWENLRRALLELLVQEPLWMADKRLELHGSELELHFDLQLENGQEAKIRLVARLDRVDRLAEDGALVVIDYKTMGGRLGPKERGEISALIQPQLPIYLLALQKEQQGEAAKLAGAIEIRIRTGERGGVVGEEYASIFKSAQFQKLSAAEFLPSFEQQLKSLLRRLLQHELAPAPRKAERCGLGNCPYWGLCRYDINEGFHAAQ